jgi:putative phosphoesterase
MRVLIVSDNHGEEGIVQSALEHNGGDLNLHLGDSEFTFENGELQKFNTVRGNVDEDSRFPVESHDEDTNIFLTHGHLYNIKPDREVLSERALEFEAKYALYGHSHVALTENINGIYCINPGSISQPKGEWEASYCVLDTANDTVEFYNRDHEKFEEVNLLEL